VADESPEARAYRRGFRQKNKRDDYALDLFQEARAKLASDQGRVGQILNELSRLYNPLTNGPIMDLQTSAAIMSRLEAGRSDEAVDLLHRRYELYAPIDDAERGGPGTPEA
jgi:hypothetical protein